MTYRRIDIMLQIHDYIGSLVITDHSVFSCILPEIYPNVQSENVCLHVANTFLNTDDVHILLPLEMSFEPESMPGQNQYLIPYKLPLTLCCTEATSWGFCFLIYLSGDIYSTRANERPNEENTG